MLLEKMTTDKILIFDLDDTIVVSTAKIIVYDKKKGEKYELTPEEFNDYEKNADHILDFEQFKSLEIMKAGKMIDKYFNVLKKNYKKGRRAYDDTEYRRNRKLIRKQQRYCVWCGSAGTSNNKLQVDHIVPVSKNGSHHISNLRILCQSCHKTRQGVAHR